MLALWLTLGFAPALMAQDAATTERLNKLEGRIEDLTAGQQALAKQIEALAKQVEDLREQMSKPSGNYAAQEDLKRVADAVREVDRKRMEDAESVKTELLNLRQAVLKAPVASSKKTPPSASSENPRSDRPEKGFEYMVKSGDTLSTIVQAYREKNIKVSLDQILKANPELKPERLRPGQKIFIPQP